MDRKTATLNAFSVQYTFFIQIPSLGSWKNRRDTNQLYIFSNLLTALFFVCLVFHVPCHHHSVQICILVLPHPRHTLLALVISKLNLREGGSISTRPTNSDIEINVSALSCFIPVSLSVALIKATYDETLRIILSCPHSGMGIVQRKNL